MRPSTATCAPVTPRGYDGSVLPELAHSLERVRRRARGNGFLRRLVAWSAFACVAGGALALCARALGRVSAENAAFALVLVPASALAAWIAALRSTPDRARAAAWLDASSGGRGTLLTDFELGDARWGTAVEAALARVGPLPPFTPRGAFSRGAPAAAFALACLLVPIPRTLPGATPSFLDSTAERLREKLQTLEEEVRLDTEVADELAQRLENLEAVLADGSPEAVFEALDRLDARLEELALGAREEGRRALEGAADALRDVALAESAAANAFAEALAELARVALALNQDPLPPSLSELALALDERGDLAGLAAADALALEQALAGLTPAELASLARELSELFDGDLATLADAGLLDPASLAAAKPLKFDEVVMHDCDERCQAGGT